METKSGCLSRRAQVYLCLIAFCFTFILLTGCGGGGSAGDSNSGSGNAASAIPDQAADGTLSVTSNEAAGDMAAVPSGSMAQSEAPALETGAGASEAAESANAAPGASETSISESAELQAGQAFNEKIIYKAKVTMEVLEFNEAERGFRSMVEQTGGYLIGFTEDSAESGRSGHFTARIPAGSFQSLLDRLNNLEPVSINRTVSGQDFTQEYVDLASRLKAKQAMEARLMAYMETADKAADLITLSQRLAEVQEAMEQMKGRMLYLDQHVAYSTIDVYMTEQAAALMNDRASLSLAERSKQAWTQSWEALKSISAALIVFLVGSIPILAPLAVLALILWLLRKKIFKRNRSAADAYK